eukprot:gene6860-11024_t
MSDFGKIFTKKTEKIEIEEEAGALMEEKKETGNLLTEKEFSKRQLKRELKEVKKKAGLLDDPSNYLDIGTVYYLNNKKMENLTDYSDSLDKRNRYRKTIVPIGENEYTNTFDKLNDDKKEAYEGLPIDKKQLIAKYMMKCKLDEMGKIEKILYPFLDNN